MIEISVGMILDSTQETMRVTRNPSDHSANFGRGAHTVFLSTNMKSVTSIKLMSQLLRSSYGVYYYHKLVASSVKSDNYTKGR